MTITLNKTSRLILLAFVFMFGALSVTLLFADEANAQYNWSGPGPTLYGPCGGVPPTSPYDCTFASPFVPPAVHCSDASHVGRTAYCAGGGNLCGGGLTQLEYVEYQCVSAGPPPPPPVGSCTLVNGRNLSPIVNPTVLATGVSGTPAAAAASCQAACDAAGSDACDLHYHEALFVFVPAIPIAPVPNISWTCTGADASTVQTVASPVVLPNPIPATSYTRMTTVQYACSAATPPSPPAPPVIDTFSDNPDPIGPSDPTTLSWTNSGGPVNPGGCTVRQISPAGPTFTGYDANDSFAVTPGSAGTYTYDIQCVGPGGTSNIRTTTVTVDATPPACTWGIGTAGSGQPYLGYGHYAYDTVACSADGDVGYTQESIPSVTLRYYRCNCGAGSPFTGDIRANGSNGPITITSGSPVTLSGTWSGGGAFAQCAYTRGSGIGNMILGTNSGSSPMPGHTDPSVTSSVTYELWCGEFVGGAWSGALTMVDSVQVNVGAAAAPTVDLRANGSNSLTITDGDAVTLSWTTTNSPTSCTATGPAPWPGPKAAAGGSDPIGTPGVGTHTYNISCTNGAGLTGNDSVTVTVNTAPVPPGVNLNGPASWTQGDPPITLTWNNSGDITSCSASGSSGWSGSWSSGSALNGTDNHAPNPTPAPRTIRYTLSCTGPAGNDSDFIDVNVLPLGPPTITQFIANPIVVDYGNPTNLTWNVSGPATTFCWGNGPGFGGNQPLSGGPQATPGLNDYTTYTLTCDSGFGETDTAVQNVRVAPIVSISHVPGTPIIYGSSVNINWSAFGPTPTTCNGAGYVPWNGGKGLSGTESFNLTTDVTFGITCSNADGDSNSDSTTVELYPRVSGFTINGVPATGPAQVIEHDYATFEWDVDGPGTLNINGVTFPSATDGGWAGSKATANGSQLVGPLSIGGTYQVTAQRQGFAQMDQEQNSVEILVPAAGLTATPQQVLKGRDTDITWTAEYVQSLEVNRIVPGPTTPIPLSPAPGPFPLLGSVSGSFNTGPVDEVSVYELRAGRLAPDPDLVLTVTVVPFNPSFNEE